MTYEKSHLIIALGVGIGLGAGIGGGIGYVLADRRLRESTEKEIAGVKDLFRRLREEDAEQARADWSATPDDEAEGPADFDPESLEEEVAALGYGSGVTKMSTQYDPNYVEPTEQDIPEQEEERDNVRQIRVVNPHRDVDPDDVTQWDRDAYHPYVITEAEYRIDRPEFEKLSLTYYKGDDTLVEQDDSYIPDQDGTAGDVNLHNYFGLASGDPHVLHVRNERVEADFEITLNEGTYSHDVLGFEIEKQMVKETKKQVRKMRPRE